MSKRISVKDGMPPIIDAVQVVRCKDCEHCLPYDNINYCSHYPYKECYVVIEENGYCNYGKRRSAGGDIRE